MGKELDINPRYEGQVTIGFAALQIRGFSLPHKGDFNPMGKLWASIRRYNRQKYGVNVTGLFIHDQTDNVISCSFCLDYGYMLANDIDQRVYEQRFIDTFDEQMLTLEKTIESFIADTENGYIPYLEHVQANGGEADKEYCNEMFNRFLRNIGLKNPEDEKAKQEFKAKLAEAYEQAKPPIFNL